MLLRFIVMWLGLCVLGIGTMSVIGYAINNAPMFRWTDDVGMALNTSIGFVLTGIALVVASLIRHNNPPRNE